MENDKGAARRYALYAASAVALAAVYFWLGAQQPGGQGARLSARSEAELLPSLRSLDSAGDSRARRDLFAYAEPERPTVAAAPPPPPVETVATKPDLLAGVTVIGVVRRENAYVIFVQSGTSIRSVRIGDRFGEQGALMVQSVQGRSVVIQDTLANFSRTYTLSEE
jgi:hypothetical protein